MSLSLRSLSSHHHPVYVKSTASGPTTDGGSLGDALSSAAGSDPSASEAPPRPLIDAASPGPASSGFAALLNQLLTDSPSGDGSSNPQADGMARLKDGTDSVPASDTSSGGTSSLDALLRALADAPARTA